MKILAYYLPQFHETPENDAWWGKGFTEWTNVKKAKPLFVGHQQPRIPLNNNYYCLTNPNSLRWQASLAKKYGIYGFCIYHYWFDGKLLLQQPIELLRSTPDIDIHYCLCWANENWTNGWASSDLKILVSNDFENEQYWLDHIHYLMKFFDDPRYIKVNNEPMIVIYYPSLIKKIDKMIDFWKKEVMKAGYPGLFVVYQHHLFALDNNSHKESFDAGIEFEPDYSEFTMNGIDAHQRNRRILFSTFIRKKLHINPSVKKIYSDGPVKMDYDEAWHEILSQKLPKNMFPGAFVDWDNTPRKGRRGSCFVGATPKKFGQYFEMLIQRTKYIYNKDFIFVFSWNEWGEGGYLEPDTIHQYKYLECIETALKKNDEFPN